MNESTSIVGSIELIPLGPSDLSPLLTNVKVKVFHLGENRNRSSIDKTTAIQMAKTLRGLPIVGKYRQEKGDFTDHGEVITIDDRGINRTTETKPYGFIDLNAQVWFEDFIDVNAKTGKQEVHTYVVTQGVVWTGQNPELKEAMIDGGRPQSMELDEKTLQGYWAKSEKSNIDFFIINSSIITKLCILGEDTEPCFIGSSVTPSDEISSTFTKLDGKDDFSHTLFSMLKELRELKNNKGGYSMENEQINVTEETVTEPVVTTFEDGGDPGTSETAAEPTSSDAESSAESADVASATEAPAGDSSESTEELPATEVINGETVLSSEVDEACANTPKGAAKDFACGSEDDEDKKDKKFEKDEDKEKDDSQDKDDKSSTDENEDNTEEDKKKYELLENEYNELKAQFSLLESEVVELRKFKNEVEDAKKEELINSFYMLSEEDKKDVVDNKAKYSLEDIEAKLSVICVRKRVSFNSTEDEVATATTDEAPLTFNLEGSQGENLPAWLQRVHDIKNLNN